MSHVRWAFAVLGMSFAACLAPGEPYLNAKDDVPPTLLSLEPAFDAGVPTLGRDTRFELIFSEAMEARSLRPGIQVYEGTVALLVELTSDPPPVDPNVPTDAPFRVRVAPGASGELFPANAGLTLVLRTLLTDTEGNALEGELRFPFRTGP